MISVSSLKIQIQFLSTGSSSSRLIEEKRRAKLEAETKRRRESRRETEGGKSYEDWWSDESGSRWVPKKKGQKAW